MREVKKAKWLGLMIILAMLLSLVPATAGAENSDYDCFPLYAGQTMEVGSVCVKNDGEFLYVKYSLDDAAVDMGWWITETHLHVGKALADFPRAGRQLNPVPGQFDYSDPHGDVTEYEYLVPLGNWVAGTELIIGAHAVVEREECTLVAEAPYPAFQVVDSDQGLRKDKTPVRVGRSDPDAVLTYDLGQDETNFFSLGFKFDEAGAALAEGGWIIVEFDCPIKNGEGNDIMVVEDTWGTYPLETADVYASQDGSNWVYLGAADNTERTVNNIHTESYFDLEDVDLEWAKFIKVVDTTPIGAMPNDGDGYDLNTIVALHDCWDCVTYSETAWGATAPGMIRFTEKGNWATYFNYTVKEEACEPVLLDSVIVTPFGTGSDLPIATYSTLVLEAGKDYTLVAKGTYRFANWGEYGIADAAWNYRSAAYAPGGVAGWYQQATNRLQVWVGGAAVSWQPAEFNPAHIYTLDITGADATLMFTIMDTAYGDNSGHITVEIWGCQTP